MRAGGYYLLCYYILFCTKPAYLTARTWPFSIDFNDNNFGCGTKKCMWVGDGKLLYYKSWPYNGATRDVLIILIEIFMQVIQYPSEEAMRKRIRDHYTWNMYKQTMTNQVKRRV